MTRAMARTARACQRGQVTRGEGAFLPRCRNRISSNRVILMSFCAASLDGSDQPLGGRAAHRLFMEAVRLGVPGQPIEAFSEILRQQRRQDRLARRGR